MELSAKHSGGNAIALETWLANAPSYGEKYKGGSRPKAGDHIDVYKKFIVDCYEKQLFKNTSNISSTFAVSQQVNAFNGTKHPSEELKRRGDNPNTNRCLENSVPLAMVSTQKEPANFSNDTSVLTYDFGSFQSSVSTAPSLTAQRDPPSTDALINMGSPSTDFGDFQASKPQSMPMGSAFLDAQTSNSNSYCNSSGNFDPFGFSAGASDLFKSMPSANNGTVQPSNIDSDAANNRSQSLTAHFTSSQSSVPSNYGDPMALFPNLTAAVPSGQPMWPYPMNTSHDIGHISHSHPPQSQQAAPAMLLADPTKALAISAMSALGPLPHPGATLGHHRAYPNPASQAYPHHQPVAYGHNAFPSIPTPSPFTLNPSTSNGTYLGNTNGATFMSGGHKDSPNMAVFPPHSQHPYNYAPPQYNHQMQDNYPVGPERGGVDQVFGFISDALKTEVKRNTPESGSR